MSDELEPVGFDGFGAPLYPHQMTREHALEVTPGNAFLLGIGFTVAAVTVGWNAFSRWLDRHT